MIDLGKWTKAFFQFTKPQPVPTTAEFVPATIVVSNRDEQIQSYISHSDIFSPKEMAKDLKISELSARRHLSFLSKTGKIEQVLACKNCKEVLRSWHDNCPECHTRRKTLLAFRKRDNM